jgi:hypothetical protein
MPGRASLQSKFIPLRYAMQFKPQSAEPIYQALAEHQTHAPD